MNDGFVERVFAFVVFSKEIGESAVVQFARRVVEANLRVSVRIQDAYDAPAIDEVREVCA